MANDKHGFVMRKPDDFHVHLREGDVMREVVPATAKNFGRALVMPNLETPVETGEQAVEYRREILTVSQDFLPLMTIYITKATTADTIEKAAWANVLAAKFYPRSGTHNADFGITAGELLKKRAVLRAMEKHRMILCLHGEDPGASLTKREESFLPALVDLSRGYPKLRIVLEHITTEKAARLVYRLPNVAATITAHHMLLTWDNVIGDHDCLCMPCAKSEEDRAALIEAATSGSPKFFFGSDSAPHPRRTKERAKGSFGIYTAPIAIPLVAEVFRLAERMKHFEGFMARWGSDWYEIGPGGGEIELIREGWDQLDPVEHSEDAETIRPFLAGQRIPWRVNHG